MPTLTTISPTGRQPNLNFESWQGRNNAPEISKEGFSEGRAGAKAWSGFAQAWAGYKDSTKIQEAIQNHNLNDKDWDFTLDKGGNIKVIEGDDQLSYRAVKDLEEALNGSEFGYHFKDMAVGLVGKSQLSVNTYDNLNSMTKYDIHTENISDILRGRELMEQPRADWENMEAVFSRQIDRAAEKLGLNEKVDLTYRSIEVEI